MVRCKNILHFCWKFTMNYFQADIWSGFLYFDMYSPFCWNNISPLFGKEGLLFCGYLWPLLTNGVKNTLNSKNGQVLHKWLPYNPKYQPLLSREYFLRSHIKYSLYFSLSDFLYLASKMLHTIWLHEDCSSTQGVAKGMTLMTSCMASQQGGGRRPCLQHCWHIKAWRDHKVHCIHYFWIIQTCLNMIKQVWTWSNMSELVQTCLNLFNLL